MGCNSKPSSFKKLGLFMWLSYICLVVVDAAETSSRSDFLQNRPDKGLFYFHNATGNFVVDKDGNCFDTTRLMMDDEAFDVDER